MTLKRNNRNNSKTLVILMITFIITVIAGTIKATETIKKQEMKNAFRNIYTIYSNTLVSTVADMSGSTGCYYSDSGESDLSNCDNFYRTFVNNMKIKKYCQNNGLEQGCVGTYEKYTTDKRCSGFFERMISKEDDIFLMENGSSIIIFKAPNGSRTPFFAVDVNGPKGPNKAGEDLFSILLMRHNSGSYYFHSNISYCLPIDKGGIEYIQDIYK